MPIKTNPTPPAERLDELFRYNRETGQLIWKVSRGGAKAGSVAGYVRPDGYIRIRVDGEYYMAHCLAWKITYGEDLAQGLDINHIDNNPSNNAISNLEKRTHRGNCSIQKVIKSGLPVGVYFSKQRNRYKAQIQLNGKRYSLGYYRTPKEASRAYRTALEMHEAGSSPEDIKTALGIVQRSPAERQSRFKGIYWNKGRQKWVAQATVNGKSKFLGYFKTEEEAAEAVDRFQKRLLE